MKTLKLLLAVLLIPAMAVPAGFVLADDAPAGPAPELNMIVGDLETIPVNDLKRVSVTNPEIADISDATKDKVTLVGKRGGQTAVFLWDADGKHTVAVHVATQDLVSISKRVSYLLSEADLKTVNVNVDAAEGKVVVAGSLPKEKRLQLDKVLEPFGDQVINLVKEESSDDLIQIDMQITELGTTLDKNLGFDWQGGAAGNPLSLDYTETGLPTGGSKNWFKFGQFNRTTAIINTLNLLIQEGKAKDLSRPRILVSSGKEATINVGGEVPIQSTTTSATGGLTQSNITFKQYGVTLTVTPTVKEGKIDVLMNLEVTDVDNTFPIRATTTNDIAYKTRSAQTQLLLDDRQTVVFAGLIRYSESQQTKRVPFLSNIPIVGLLFRDTSKQSPDQGKELVVTLTPTILRHKEYVTALPKMPSQALANVATEIDQEHGLETEPIPVPPPAAPAQQAAPAPAVPAVKAQEEVPLSEADSRVLPYVRAVQMKISQAISYPPQALQNNWQGTVKLRLHVLKDGSLADASIAQSSGHDIFDTDALNTARSSAPYGPFSPDMTGDELTITLPIVYNSGATSQANTQTVVASY